MQCVLIALDAMCTEKSYVMTCTYTQHAHQRQLQIWSPLPQALQACRVQNRLVFVHMPESAEQNCIVFLQAQGRQTCRESCVIAS